MMNYIDDFVSRMGKISAAEQIIDLQKNQIKDFEQGYDGLVDLALSEAGFRKQEDIVFKGSEGWVYKHDSDDIYIMPSIDGNIGSMRVWLNPEDKEEFKTYLENDEFWSKESIQDFNEYRTNTIFPMSIALGVIGFGAVMMTSVVYFPESKALMTPVGLGVYFTFFSTGMAIKSTKLEKLEAALARHDKYLPDYEGFNAVAFLGENYGTVGTLE